MEFTDFISGNGDFPPYDNNNEPRLKKQRGRKKRKVETGSAFAAINGYLDADVGDLLPLLAKLFCGCRCRPMGAPARLNRDTEMAIFLDMQITATRASL